MAVCEFFNAELAWVCEVEKGPSQVLARHFAVPNLGDITKADWQGVESVDILCGGFPCQDISNAGGRAGIKQGTRSGLWFEFARAIRSLRPIYVVVENVSNLLAIDNGRGFGIVLADLAEAGFDAEWCSVRASDVGAPHRRERIFLLATHPDLNRRLGGRPESEEVPGLGERAGLHLGPTGPIPLADPLCQPVRDGSGDVGGPQGTGEGEEPERQRVRPHDLDGDSSPATDTAGIGHERTRARNGRPGPTDIHWGAYGLAIDRWEQVRGLPAPVPHDERGRLAVSFVEWMMGFPVNWTHGLSRAAALKALGNAVVPQQALYALDRLAA
jgi:DNA (cytosine-5)-methyltransferase 1